MKRKRAPGAMRLFGRLLAAGFVTVLFTLISIQFARIVGDDVAMAHTLSSVRRDIVALRAHNRRDAREMKRLLDPEGAVPEIHDRLHLVRPNEAIIYLKPAPPQTP